jgi:SAM-dependent methyltransferase
MTDRIDFDNYTEKYSRLLQERTSFFSADDTHFARYKIDLMKSHLSKSVKTVLEYGCGIGRNIPFLREAFPQAVVIGTDISRASLEIARRDQPDVEFFEEDNPVFNMESFDLIFVASVFHHVPVAERSKVSRLLFQRLKLAGDLFIFEHNPYNPVTRRIVSTCPYDDDAVLLTPSELKRYLEAVGFKQPHTKFCLFIPPSLSWLTWIERRLGWLPLGGQYFVHFSK